MKNKQLKRKNITPNSLEI